MAKSSNLIYVLTDVKEQAERCLKGWNFNVKCGGTFLKAGGN